MGRHGWLVSGVSPLGESLALGQRRNVAGAREEIRDRREGLQGCADGCVDPLASEAREIADGDPRAIDLGLIDSGKDRAQLSIRPRDEVRRERIQDGGEHAQHLADRRDVGRDRSEAGPAAVVVIARQRVTQGILEDIVRAQ